MSGRDDLDPALARQSLQELDQDVQPGRVEAAIDLLGVAYRMLGSIAEAEDVVQDAFLRWRDHTTDVADPRAYLATVVTRLCLDRLKSARARREAYVGTWLPEPLVEGPGPGPGVEVDDSRRSLHVPERESPTPRSLVARHPELVGPTGPRMCETQGVFRLRKVIRERHLALRHVDRVRVKQRACIFVHCISLLF